MKIFLIITLLVSFNIYSQDTAKRYLPHFFSASSSFQNEDIFLSLGGQFPINKTIAFEIRYGVGARRTIFQHTLFSKVDGVILFNMIRSEKWNLGPSALFSIFALTPQIFKPIQRYYSAELGYYFAYGKKLKVTQSTYFGYRSMNFVPKTKRYPYFGYGFQLGLCYAI